jgi:hypothetical protein
MARGWHRPQGSVRVIRSSTSLRCGTCRTGTQLPSLALCSSGTLVTSIPVPHTHSPIKHGACTQNTAHARAEPICCAWTATSDRFSREIITIIIIIICSAASALTEIELVDNKIVRLSTHH